VHSGKEKTLKNVAYDDSTTVLHEKRNDVGEVRRGSTMYDKSSVSPREVLKSPAEKGRVVGDERGEGAGYREGVSSQEGFSLEIEVWCRKGRGKKRQHHRGVRRLLPVGGRFSNIRPKAESQEQRGEGNREGGRGIRKRGKSKPIPSSVNNNNRGKERFQDGDGSAIEGERGIRREARRKKNVTVAKGSGDVAGVRGRLIYLRSRPRLLAEEGALEQKKEV